MVAPRHFTLKTYISCKPLYFQENRAIIEAYRQKGVEPHEKEVDMAEPGPYTDGRAVIFSGLSVLYAQFDIKRPISDTGYSRAGNGSFYNF